MSSLFIGAEILLGVAGIVAGVLIARFARGSRLTSLSLSIVPVGALALIVIGAALILNAVRVI